jgi:hypothetical protein
MAAKKRIVLSELNGYKVRGGDALTLYTRGNPLDTITNNARMLARVTGLLPV